MSLSARFAFAIAIWSWAPSSLAQDALTKANLVWTESADGCPGPAVLQREVEELAGHRVFFDAQQADVTVRGGVSAQATELHGWFEARDAQGELVGTRALEGQDCVQLQHSLALVLTILLDRPPGRPVQQPVEPLRDERPRDIVRAGAWSGLLSGTLPRVAPGVGVLLEVAPARWLHLRADAAAWLPQTTRDASGIGARFSGYSAGLVLCPRWTVWAPRELAITACAGGQLGAIRAQPQGLEGPHALSRLLGQATIELALSIRVQRYLALFVSAGTAISLTRPRFFYDRADGSEGSLQRPASAGAIARLGLTIGRP